MVANRHAGAGEFQRTLIQGENPAGAGDPRSLLQAFWALCAGLAVMYLYALVDTDALSVFWAFAISAAALLPGYLWCSGRAQGVPVLPLFAASHVWAFAFPLVSDHPLVALYDQEQRAVACVSVMGFLLLATFVWYQFVNWRREPKTFSVRMAFPRSTGDGLFLFALGASSFFTLVIYQGWFNLDSDILSSLRGIILGLGALGIFVLAYRWGSGDLERNDINWFILLLFSFITVNATSTLLVGSMTSFMLAIIGYSVGRRRVPWAIFSAGIGIFLVLHVGKGEIRDRYLYAEEDGSARLASLSQYPSFFLEWFSGSIERLTDNSSQSAGQSLLQRASLLHLLLMVEQDSPYPVPFLYGATYAHIPQQLVPRLLYPDKISSHEGTILLNLHYELQASRDEATVTSIGWGLMSESYANFGYWGMAGLAIFLGSLFGALSWWGLDSPVLSFRFLCNLLVLAMCFNTEISTGAFFASIYQSFLALVGVSLPLMKPVLVDE